ncbi:MAG: peptide chain release factor N(5)-glutamine methyltransferase [Fimbriimonadaceae bacterium]|nr:peptide chain release factor N(5)-glutamine methyltransferase [Fimbriimonadaceae bacterium]
MTVGEALAVGESRLRAGGIVDARLEAQLLVGHAMGWSRVQVLTYPDAEIPELAWERLVSQRLAHVPMAYLLGYREFFGRRFAVNPDVLIPRHETELIVERALALADRPRRVLDLGTGSGCLAITLAQERPSWTVWGVDRSERALRVAARNAEELGAQVTWVQSDWGAAVSGPFDLVVSNPPYIGTGEPLPPEVADHEPSLALYAGPDGLEAYRQIAAEANRYAPGADALFEIGAGQGETVPELLRAFGWSDITGFVDLAGLPRVVQARVPT